MESNTAAKMMAETDDKLALAQIRVQLLEVQIALLVKAGTQVLLDIDDDGAVERDDIGVLALREAVKLGPATEIDSVIACARRVHAKFGAGSDWSEWRDLGDALADIDQWPLKA